MQLHRMLTFVYFRRISIKKKQKYSVSCFPTGERESTEIRVRVVTSLLYCRFVFVNSLTESPLSVFLDC